MYPIILSKSITSELNTKLDGVVADWDGSEVNGRKYEDLMDRIWEHSKTSCREPFMVNAWDAEAIADELENSASALKDNGYTTTARTFMTKAEELRKLVDDGIIPN